MDGSVIISNINRNGRASFGKNFLKDSRGTVTREKRKRDFGACTDCIREVAMGGGPGGTTQFLARPEPSGCKYVNGDIQGEGVDLLE
jgi:hypothetical protein